MRTTIEVPDDLMKRARAEAALSGRSPKNLFIDALQEKLSGRWGTRTQYTQFSHNSAEGTDPFGCRRGAQRQTKHDLRRLACKASPSAGPIGET